MAPFGDVFEQDKEATYEENGIYQPPVHRVLAVVNVHGSVENVVMDETSIFATPNEEMYFSNQNYLDSGSSRSSGTLSDILSASAPRALSTDSDIDSNSDPSTSNTYYSSFRSRVLNSDLDATPPHWMNVIYDISDAPPELPATAAVKQVVTSSDFQKDIIEVEGETEKEINSFRLWDIFTCCFKKSS